MLPHRRTAGRIALVLLTSTLTLVGGCVAQPTQSTGRPVRLEFLQNGPVSRASADRYLGPPSATFDQGRVVTYRLSQTTEGYFIVPQAVDPHASSTKPKHLNGSSSSGDANFEAPIDWQGITHDLVLAFDETGRVSEYRLIAIHQPVAPH